MKRWIRTTATVSAVTAILAFSACTSGDDGIFASIEREVKVNENNLSDEAYGIGIERYAPGGGTDYFVAAIGVGKLFYRTVDGSSWSSMPRPGEVQFLASMDDATLFAATQTGVYSLSGDEPNIADWTLVYDDREVTGMVAVDDKLLITVVPESGDNAPSSRNLIANPQSATPATLTGITDDIAHAARYSDQIVIVGLRSGYFRVAAASLGADGSVTVISSSDSYYPRSVADGWDGTQINGVVSVSDAALTNGWLVLSSVGGRAFAYDGTQWYRSSSTGDVLTGLVSVADGRALVGTSSSAIETEYANGYYDVLLDSESSPRTVAVSAPTTSNYDAIVLEDVGIRRFTSAGTTIFALTDGFGIWRISNYTDSSSEWSWE